MKKPLHKLIFFTMYLLTAMNVLSAQSIAAGGSSSYAICDTGTIMKWGTTTGTGGSFVPMAFGSLSNIVKIEANGNNLFAIKNDGTLWASGSNNSYGGLGIGTNNSAALPIQVNLTDVIAVAAGHLHSLFLKSDGTVWSSGWNVYGELGIGNNLDTNLPVQIPSLSGITAISAGKYHSVALKNDGTVWVWGSDAFSQLGNGSPFTASNIPIQVAGISNVIAIDTGMYFTHALKSDGTLWGWGQNYNGELGCGQTANSLVPVQTAGLTDIVSFADGYTHAFAIKSDGVVYGWGAANSFQLGNGSTATNYTPVVIPGLNGSIKIVSGEFHGLAIKNDNTVRSWGYNANGQLGSGSTAWNETPALVASSLCSLLAIDKISTDEISFSIFPNPANNEFQIKFKTFGSDSFFEVYNNIGALIQKNRIYSENTTINISSYSKGLYFIKVSDDNKSTTQKLLVK